MRKPIEGVVLLLIVTQTSPSFAEDRWMILLSVCVYRELITSDFDLILSWICQEQPQKRLKCSPLSFPYNFVLGLQARRCGVDNHTHAQEPHHARFKNLVRNPSQQASVSMFAYIANALRVV